MSFKSLHDLFHILNNEDETFFSQQNKKKLLPFTDRNLGEKVYSEFLLNVSTIRAP